MNRKEISEIRKQFRPENCSITRICGCYIDAEQNRVTSFADSFLTLPEEEMYKYLEIFRKTLSGPLGKNLINMEFPTEAEMGDGAQTRLLKLRDSALQEEDLLEQYYDDVCFDGSCLILLVYAVYDVPGRTTDEFEQFDASDEAYSFILSCICPVSLAKPALSYDASRNGFHNRIRDWIVEMPSVGFLFPAFNDRSSDIHSLLFYTKDANDLHEEFAEKVLGSILPMTASDQKDVFAGLIEDALGDECDLESVKSVHVQLYGMKEQQKDSPDPIMLDKREIRNILELSGADYEQTKRLEEHYGNMAGEDARLQVSNIVNTRKFEVKTPDVVIQVNPEKTELIEERMVDGRKCLVIPVTDQVTVNGIRLNRRIPKES